MSDVRKIKSGLVKFPFDQFIGEAGNLFFDPDTGSLFLSDGVTPGGIPVGGGGGGGGGDVSKFGTPVNDQLAVWRNSTTIEGDTKLTWNGTNFTITGNVVVSGTVDGRDLSADGSKLDSIEAGATADMTPAEIKVAYESNANTNPFTDAEQSKLAGIQIGATDDQTGAEITSSLDVYLGSTDWRTGGGGTGVTDGDKGDITVSGTGATWTIDAGAVTLAKQAPLAANSIIGNNTGSSGTPIALSAAQTKALLAIVAADVADFSEAVDDRVNALLLPGANITLTYNDVANTLTIASPTAVSLTGQWRFDSTTTMANPGNGDIRLNNAAMASVTQIAIAELSNSGVDTQNYLATLRVNDIFYLQDENDATKFGRFVINAAPTDNGTWWQLSVTYVNSGAGGTPANNQICRIAFLLNNGGGGGGSASAMSDLTDVDLTGLSNNDILVYDSTSSTWKPEPNGGGSGGTAFMPQVDLIDDTNGTYYYFGWVDGGNGYWQINRQTRVNALIVRADSINNIAIPDLASAWPLRAGLTYS